MQIFEDALLGRLELDEDALLLRFDHSGVVQYQNVL
jgi:hypothetical protein